MSKLAEKLKAIRERSSTEVKQNVVTVAPSATVQANTATELIPDQQVDTSALIVRIDQIEVGDQARKQFKNIEELAASIQQKGQLQPVVVREIAPHRYQLLAGERRLRACRLLGREAIKAVVLADIEDELQWRLLQLTENLQREDYAPLELAVELRGLKERFGFSDADLATQLQLSRTWVWKQLSLLDAPAEIRVAIKEGRVAATDYLNNKSRYLTHSQESSSAANDQHVPSDRGTVTVSPKSDGVITPIERIPTLQIPLPAAMEIASLFNSLADIYGSNPVSLNKKPSKKELTALLTSRAAELHRLVKRKPFRT